MNVILPSTKMSSSTRLSKVSNYLFFRSHLYYTTSLVILVLVYVLIYLHKSGIFVLQKMSCLVTNLWFGKLPS